MIALEIGGSTRLCSILKPGEPVVAMGPTGHGDGAARQLAPCCCCGGGLGNAVLFSIGKKARELGNRVVYFAGYKKAEDFYKREELEAAADVLVLSVDRGEPIPARRPTDRSFVGNIVEAMLAYATGKLGERRHPPLATSSGSSCIGSDRMMAAVARSRKTVLAPYLKPDHVGIASINSPMQCMMKEVCAQCLQKHVDPVTGKEEIVFSCLNQDQLMDEMDWGNLAARLRQNTVSEKLTNLWLDRLFATERLRAV